MEVKKVGGGKNNRWIPFIINFVMMGIISDHRGTS
jgi:hypothetical protein